MLRCGYAVEETGLGGADGGIDLVLRHGGRRILVQCKQWRRERVPVSGANVRYWPITARMKCALRRWEPTPDAARFATGRLR